MSDEFVNRYSGLSHEQLWTQLKAGDPGQIDTLATKWKSLHDTADSLANALNTDLGKLTAGWSSSSGTEYQRRLSLVSSYSTTMSGEFSDMQHHLTMMAGDLRKAQKQAEDPANTDNNNGMITDAAVGFAVAGPVGGLVGGLFGHHEDQVEKEKARQRMIQLVAGLAAEYSVTTDAKWSQIAPLPPTDLPGDNTTSSRYTPKAGPGVNTPGGVSATSLAIAGHTTAAGPKTPSQVPATGNANGEGQDGEATIGPDGNPIDTSSGLAGAGELAGAGLLGLGGLGTAFASAGGSAGMLGLGYGSGSGLAGANSPASGLAGANGSGSGSGLASGSGEAGGRSVTGNQVTGRQGKAAGSGRGDGTGDEEDERMTWLTEDDMVWGAEDAPPSVLGERPAEEAPAPE